MTARADHRAVLRQQELQLKTLRIGFAAAEAAIVRGVRERRQIVEVRFHRCTVCSVSTCAKTSASTLPPVSTMPMRIAAIRILFLQGSRQRRRRCALRHVVRILIDRSHRRLNFGIGNLDDARHILPDDFHGHGIRRAARQAICNLSLRRSLNNRSLHEAERVGGGS